MQVTVTIKDRILFCAHMEYKRPDGGFKIPQSAPMCQCFSIFKGCQQVIMGVMFILLFFQVKGSLSNFFVIIDTFMKNSKTYEIVKIL